MIPSDIIKKKRDGGTLSRDEMRSFFDAYATGAIEDAQVAAFLMAVYHNGMNRNETIALTEEYVQSGSRIDLSDVSGVCVDKHSTGGVGDKTTLLLAPIVAAAGVKAVFISGRGLDFTGGTLDKLESIPGMRVKLTLHEIRSQITNVGAVIAGQSDAMTPLERRIYALRDVTATVESLPLIAASIISKKAAGGASSIVLDVKRGKGAFMRTAPEAEALALMLADIGAAFGLHVSGCISAMDEPLGYAAGNWLEVVETVDFLRGTRSPDLSAVTLELAGRMIHAGNKAASVEEGETVADEMIRSGLAYQKLLEIVEAQGGDVSVVEETLKYRIPDTITEVSAPRTGYISGINAKLIGEAVRGLGGGRTGAFGEVDHNAGIVLHKKHGDLVEEGDPLCRLQLNGRKDISEQRRLAEQAFSISATEPEPLTYILAGIDGGRIQRTIDLDHEAYEK